MTILDPICKICLKKARKTVCKTYKVILVALLLTGIFCVLFSWWSDHSRKVRRYIENKLVESLKFDKGMGCKIPELDPLSRDVFDPYDVIYPTNCINGPDWVKCYHSECRVVDEIKRTMTDVSCDFSDILYKNDLLYEIGPKTLISDGVYRLRQSDHVKVSCTGINTTTANRQKWIGNTLGLRPVKPKSGDALSRERSYNVLIFGFDSMPKNGFIRRMPLSWRVLTEELDATVMNGFHVLGEDTNSTLLPLLTGKSELDIPDLPEPFYSTNTLDSFPFIFYKLKEDGYRTAYFEDRPDVSSIQHYNGFRQQPADHYLRAFFLEENRKNYIDGCVGDTHQYKLMMNITQQFMELGGKRFAFTIIADIMQDEFDAVQAPDADAAAFLRYCRRYAEDTLLVVMSDHGSRYTAARDTLQGKLEERLPLLAIRLPDALVRDRPAAAEALRANQMTLTTPHDLHATILDVLGMTQHWDPYKVEGADLPRAITMLQPIPQNRSCSEAGVETHWCVCTLWEYLEPTDPLYRGAARALERYINDAVSEIDLCRVHEFVSVGPVSRQRYARDLVPLVSPFGAPFLPDTRTDYQIIQVKIVTRPGRAVYEATMRYETRTGEFLIDRKDVTRINPYAQEAHCVMKTHPDISPFCYCKAMRAVFQLYVVIFISALVTILCVCHTFFRSKIFDHDFTRRYVENKLVESLKLDKGMGCEIPELDPFSSDVFNPKADPEPIDCSGNGRDWVRCYHSECRIVDEIKRTMKEMSCDFSDILYKSDLHYKIGPKTAVRDGVYRLRQSDHVKVACTGINITTGYSQRWLGNTLGLRPVEPRAPPPGRERSHNVLIFGFDSMPKNGFIRSMPLSWRVLTEELGATVMHGFNVLGDGTPATLFPLLTGKSELELPDVRKRIHSTNTLDTFPFIFYKLKEDGYRTAYYEDMPEIGTFQYRFNGFRNQPADHYLRAFLLEENLHGNWLRRLVYGKNDMEAHCVGDTQQFKLMINITRQFMELGGKRFAFSFIADISHDESDMIQLADEDTAAFLRYLQRYAADTLLVVMSDHGPRFSSSRETLQGKLEERLPLLAIRLPNALVRERPTAAEALRANQMTLTTPHDLHATILDVLEMTQHWSPYKVGGADLPRALTMLQPIPRSRSCSEAGVEPHWCACAAWEPVDTSDPVHHAAARALLRYINHAVREVGGLCAERTLTSVSAVSRQQHRRELLQFAHSIDPDGYRARLDRDTRPDHENLQVKIVVGPGRGVYEATMRHETKTGQYLIDMKDISRISPYNKEPDCIRKTHPHLNPFCYCM